MVDLIRCSLPVSRNLTEIVADPVLEQSGANVKVVKISEIYKLLSLHAEQVLSKPTLVFTSSITMTLPHLGSLSCSACHCSWKPPSPTISEISLSGGSTSQL